MASLDVLDRQARRQRLLELVSLFQILDAQRVQVFAAAHLELDDVLRLLDLDGCEQEYINRTRERERERERREKREERRERETERERERETTETRRAPQQVPLGTHGSTCPL